MENNALFTDDLLWDYADGLLDAAEHQRVTELLERQPEAQSRLADILAEKKSFAALPLEAPKPGFSDRVLAAWAVEQMQLSAPKRRDWMIIAITGVFGLCLLLPVVVLLVTTLRGDGPTLPADYALPAIDWGAYWPTQCCTTPWGWPWLFSPCGCWISICSRKKPCD